MIQAKQSIWIAALTALALAAGTLLAGCGKDKNKYVPPPPPEVTVAPPVQKAVVEYAYYTGNTQALEAVEVRAQVEGVLKSMHFAPSSRVKKGDLLFIIDPRPYQAKLDQAKAQLAQKQAALALAEATLIRKERAYRDRAVSEVEVIQARAEKAQALADIKAAEAQVEAAQINLDYTHVTAPISGVVSRNLVDVGNLVGSGQNTVLTTINNYDSVYAYFNVSERDLLRYKRSKRERKVPLDKEGRFPVYLATVGEKGYPHQGWADYIDNTVDPGTGTIQVRARFPNPNHWLVPGLFVRLRLPMNLIENALLVPDQALSADQGGRYLLVVDKDNKVQYRKVTVGDLYQGMRVILTGLKPGERVVINGLQRARPGSTVRPVSEAEAKARAEAEKAKAKAKAEGKSKAKPAPKTEAGSSQSKTGN